MIREMIFWEFTLYKEVLLYKYYTYFYCLAIPIELDLNERYETFGSQLIRASAVMALNWVK